jgi:hypothetical protein
MNGLARILWAALAAVGLAGCASLSERDALQVTVAGIEPLPGEGLELRMLVELRVQNPNDAALDYDGAYVRLDVQGKTFATGVTDQSGTVPRFGEAVIKVPVTVSMLRLARQALGMLDDEPAERIRYEMSGKLNRTNRGTVRFRSEGDFDFPAAPSAPVEDSRL